MNPFHAHKQAAQAARLEWIISRRALRAVAVYARSFLYFLGCPRTLAAGTERR